MEALTYRLTYWHFTESTFHGVPAHSHYGDSQLLSNFITCISIISPKRL